MSWIDLLQPMDPQRQEFNWFVRRWQVRLFVAAFVLPVLCFLLASSVPRLGVGDSAGLSVILACGLLLAALLLQLWRVKG
jgi:hypothetical protein